MDPLLVTEFARTLPTASCENKRAPAAADRAVGAQIRRLRRASGMTLKTVGDAVGVSSVQLQRYEVGASRVAASRLLAIAEALDVTVDVLLGTPHPILDSPPGPGHSEEAIELLRVFSGISDPAHRRAIVAFIRAVAMPPSMAEERFVPSAPLMSVSINSSNPGAGE